MDWQQILTLLLLVLAVLFLLKKIKNPKDNCENRNCDCK